MTQTVQTILSVIDGMNITDEDRLLLIQELNKATVKKPIRKTMTKKELLHREFERWAVKNKVLYPPKRF